eukprot:TRINITY_DN1732_c0_g3_i1.p1 TRINITY_DN1732_c0_g3~~TRINITY_DN1732_c0_g3_i1.p1  ORF type:complete len:577 (-),score=75.02 TRINITY_DN1732_c0_g3_i1:268-1878(-)
MSDWVCAPTRSVVVTTAAFASSRIQSAANVVVPHVATLKQTRRRSDRMMLMLAFCACSTMASSPQHLGRRTSKDWQASMNANEERIVIPVRARPKADVSIMHPVATTPMQPQDQPSMLRRLMWQQRKYVASLHNNGNVQYVADVVIGRDCKTEEGQPFVVVADTGSSDLWVKARSSKYPKGYDINKSCTAVDDGEHRTFTYGDGTNTEGNSTRDKVTIGGITVKDAVFFRTGIVENEGEVSDGIMGLRLLNDPEHFLAMLFEQYPHIPRQFQTLLSVMPYESLMIIGQDDLKKYGKEREFRYATSDWLWNVRVLSVGLKYSGFKYKFRASSLVDTGTTQILLPPDAYEQVASQLTWRFSNCALKQKSSTISLLCDCPNSDDLSRLPGLAIEIERQGGGSFTLCVPPKEMLFHDLSGKCVLSVAPHGQMILGQGLLRSYVTNFDVEGQRIGFALRKASPEELGDCTTDPAPSRFFLTWLSGVILCLVAVVQAVYILMLPGPSRTKREIHAGGDNAAFESIDNISQNRTNGILELPPL